MHSSVQHLRSGVWQADADMRKESYQRSQSKLQGEVDGLKSHISKQDEQRARGLDGVIHEVDFLCHFFE